MNPHTGDVAFPLLRDRLDASLNRLRNLIHSIKRYSQRASAVTGLDAFVTWCQVFLTQGCGHVREFIHGGLEYQATFQKIQELERQLQQLLEEKEALEKSAAAAPVPLPPTECSKCGRCQGDKNSLHSNQDGTVQGTAMPPPSQPPPPPPPPPPLPPPPPQVKVPFRIVKKAGSQVKDNSKENKLRPLVTAEELQKVKLRRPGERTQSQNKGKSSPSEKPVCGDLRRMALRKTQSAVVLRDVGNMLPIQAADVARQKQHLKKTTMKRSPGGTPMRDCKRRRESGQGLTPMMNKALRLKFQAQSPCLSSESDNSPISSPDTNNMRFVSPSVEVSSSSGFD